MERNWTRVGSEWTADQELAARAFKRLVWLDVPRGPTEVLELGAMPGMAVQEAIRQLKIPKVSKIAVGRFRRQQFYGIEGNYRNGRVRVYVLDLGNELVPLASDFFEAAVVA